MWWEYGLLLMNSDPQVAIRTMVAEDWPEVRQIYEAGIATKMATFETKVPDWPRWNQKHLSIGRLVAVDQKQVIGWTALSAVSTRTVYRGVAELSIYICLLYTSPSPRDRTRSRMPSSA